MGKYLVGIDGGTTGCKTVVFDLDGNIIGSDYREYPCYYPKTGWVEQTAEDITPALFDSCKAAITASGVDPKEILAVGFSSQGSVIGLLDENGKCIRPFVGWQDLRSGEKEIEWITDRMPREDYYQLTGDPLGNIFSITKLVWLKENEPENWAKTAMFSTHQDYFLKELGADGYYTDLSSASRDGMCDVNNHVWAMEIFDMLEIPLEKRPKLITEPGKVVGHIPADVAQKTGLAEGTPLCMGAHDQNCCTFGAGAVEDGTAVMVIGTFGSSFVVSDKPIRDPKSRLVVKGNHGVGNWTIEAFSNTAASSYRWYRDTFCDLEKAAGAVSGIDPYELINSQIASVPPGANGITFLSYLQGASGSRINSNARGTFVGMCLGTKKADMARSVMEGICYEMNDIVQAEQEAGIKIESIRITGGAAKSPLWCQMLADVFQKPIHILQTSETGCLGAALYAGVGIGAYESCKAAAERAVRISDTYYPNSKNFKAYEAAYQRFVNVYEALDKKVF
ncbi:xylulokinase [Acetobacterium bakii]|uniref:Carbohydrate kinase n=1 Tax=Acetobacterium bakii TaxID=52689 RepID=A0A0L6U3F7_9FIRM|nr:FGGY family carbohydrate kinase [Acetobacterium bakii]KNZ42862.1 carbohydrate kinase [Acetobacterium bakii]